jgi:CubicO group peptidase (beta-lactamase class C family)
VTGGGPPPTGEIRGLCPVEFSAVRQAFAANFAEDRELGARFALAVEGEVVIDLIGGWADRAMTRPFAEDTLTQVFSTTKAMAALMTARLVGHGRLSYQTPVAEIWPAFAAAGKEALTVEQVLSHQAGLCGLEGPMSPADWYDWDGVCARLAAMAPLWPVGSASGYHPVTLGYLAGEIFQRVDGRTIGTALREDLATPHGLDLWIGLPDVEHGRVAQVRRPPATPDLGEMTEPKRLAFFTRWAYPGGVDEATARRAEIPSANGQATAPALARLMAILALDGKLDGDAVLPTGLAAEAGRRRISGCDLVLPYEMSWGAGFIRNEGLWIYGPGRETFGHSGWGGSCAFADPERGVSGAYVMNRQSAELIADSRARRLIEAAYTAL